MKVVSTWDKLVPTEGKHFFKHPLVKGCEINSNIKLRIYVPEGTEAVHFGDVNDEQFYNGSLLGVFLIL